MKIFFSVFEKKNVLSNPPPQVWDQSVQFPKVTEDRGASTTSALPPRGTDLVSSLARLNQLNSIGSG